MENSIRTRGTGSVFKKMKNGVELPNWYIGYYSLNGKQIQESSRSPIKAVAEKMLRKKLDEVEKGVPIDQDRKLRYDDIRELLVTDYRNNGVGLISRTERKQPYVYGFDYLDQFFGGMHVKNINTPLLRNFIAALQSGEIQAKVARKDGGKSGVIKARLSNGSINRVLAVLRKMMNLARKDGLLPVVPHFPMLAEDNVREGFVDADDFKKVLSHLPEKLRPLIVFLYTTGCRLGAALDITWDMIAPDAKTMTLPGRITKNDRPIILPLPAELTAVLKKQFRKSGRVFDASNLRKEWAKATLAAGFADLLIHDLRRSGVRNLINSGVPETVAMKISGHSTNAVFKRYAIVSTEDIQAAMKAVEKNNGTLMEPKRRGTRNLQNS